MNPVQRILARRAALTTVPRCALAHATHSLGNTTPSARQPSVVTRTVITFDAETKKRVPHVEHWTLETGWVR